MAIAVETLDDRIDRLGLEEDAAWERYKLSEDRDIALWHLYNAASKAHLDALHERSMQAEEALEELHRQHVQWGLAYEEETTRYDRPQSGLVGWMSRWLGPLPANAKKIDLSDEALAALPSYRLMGFVLLCCAAGLLISLAFLAPWLVISPAGLLYGLYSAVLGPSFGMVATVLSTIGLMGFLSRGYRFPRYASGGFVDQAAASEEQWFRMGAESWNLRQRIASCVGFGFVHVINVIYPITSLLVLSLVGAVLMAVYLREHKRSGDTERAVQVATKLHTAYNRFAFVYLGAAILILGIVSFTS